VTQPLSIGTHVITATATDPFGATSTDTLTVHVTNSAPSATISEPPEGSNFFTSQEINFRGGGFDFDEPIPDANLVWMSSIDGVFGTGRDFFARLSAGTHTVTLTATDAFGLTGTDTVSVTVQVGAGFPTARILSPPNNSNFADGEQITFVGEGIDPEEGALSGASLRWSSDIDGFLGTGTMITVVLSGSDQTEIVRHRVTLEVTDFDGNRTTHSIDVLIGTIE
jgi:hypothetical protein